MRPETPSPLTLEEHRQLGTELRATNVRLQQLCGLVVSVYGPHNRAAFAFQRTVEAMERLCKDLESQAAHDIAGFSADNFYL